MSDTGEFAIKEEDSTGSTHPSDSHPMTRLRRVAMIVVLSLLCTVTLRTNTYLLGSVLGIPAAIGIPLVPTLATVWWMVPLLIFPFLRDIGSFRFAMSWTVLLIMPVLILNWCFSMYFLPIPTPWPVWLHFGSHAVAVGVFEELVFRGYAFRRSPLAHPRFVVLTSALCFSLTHLPWLFERPVAGVLHQLVFALVVGVALGIIRLVSGSLAWCMLLHSGIDAAKQVNIAKLGDVPGLQQWTPYVIGLVVVASLIVLCLHSTFKKTR